MWNKSTKYEKIGKYQPYCTRNRAITDAYSGVIKKIFLSVDTSKAAGTDQTQANAETLVFLLRNMIKIIDRNNNIQYKLLIKQNHLKLLS